MASDPDKSVDTSWRAGFLAALEVHPNESLAAQQVKVSLKLARLHKEADPEFARDWDTALDVGRDMIRARIYQYSIGRSMVKDEPPPSDRMRVRAMEMQAQMHLPELRQQRIDEEALRRQLAKPPVLNIVLGNVQPPSPEVFDPATGKVVARLGPADEEPSKSTPN